MVSLSIYLRREKIKPNFWCSITDINLWLYKNPLTHFMRKRIIYNSFLISFIIQSKFYWSSNSMISPFGPSIIAFIISPSA